MKRLEFGHWLTPENNYYYRNPKAYCEYIRLTDNGRTEYNKEMRIRSKRGLAQHSHAPPAPRVTAPYCSRCTQYALWCAAYIWSRCVVYIYPLDSVFKQCLIYI